jgi:hypothetical protein
MLLLYMALTNTIEKWVWRFVCVTLFCCFSGRLAIHLKMALLYAFSVARCQLLSADILPTSRSVHKICNSWCDKERYHILDERFCMVSCWAEYRNVTVQLTLLKRELIEDLQGTRFYGRFWSLCSAPTVIWAIRKKELDEVFITFRKMRNASNIFVGKPELVILRILA